MKALPFRLTERQRRELSRQWTGHPGVKVLGIRVVRAEGWCERVSAHHAFTAARIRDAKGVVCARAHGIVARARRGAAR